MAFDPFDTTALHIFIKESFAGALLLEEHQVRREGGKGRGGREGKGGCMLVQINMLWILIGTCAVDKT